MTDLTSLDAETIAIEATREGGPVDPAPRPTTFADVVAKTDHRRPIVPASLRSKAGRHAMLHWTLAMGTHTALYHLTRSPKYTAKVALWAPVGVWRASGTALSWAFDWESWGIRQNAATRNDVGDYLALSRQRDRRVSGRAWILGISVVALAAAVLLLTFAAPWWAQSLAVVGSAVLFARLGRPLDHPILDRVYTGDRFIRLTAELTRAAIMATGKVKDPADIKFVREIYRDGPGHTAVTDLPPGVIATDIIDRREHLAAGFRLPLDQVWPDPVEGEHPGRLQTWVADKPVSAMRQPAWPLLDGGTADFWGPIPYGFDVRLRPIHWRLDERNSLFGGVPGSGKTLAARNVALGAVLDPLVVPLISELKGSGDFDEMEPLCPKGMYVSGADQRSKEQTMELLQYVDRECDTRGPLIRGWVARGYGTVNKLNRRIAEADPRLRPLLVVLDEVQELFTDPDLGKSAVFLVTGIVKRGRSLGIHLVLATQRIDKESVPKGISSNVVNRLALAVTSHIETDLILGTGAYSRGARPTAFRPQVDAGWGVLAGMTSPVRAAYVDNRAAAAVVRRALELRAGVDAPKAERVRAYNLAEDVRTVWPAGQTGVWLVDLLALLQSLRPDVYGDLDPGALGAALRAAKVDVVKLHRKIEGQGYTRPGVRIDAVQAAIDAGETTIGAIDR